MKQQSYQQTITVYATPSEAYEALTTGYDHWWTNTLEQSFKQIGDEIKFTFPPNTSFWTMAAKKLIVNELVEIECVDAYHLITDKPAASQTEWLGTTMIWSIKANGNKTNIYFTHDGLTPELACYDVCKAGWDIFFVDSLKAYLNTGSGSPHKRKQSSMSPIINNRKSEHEGSW